MCVCICAYVYECVCAHVYVWGLSVCSQRPHVRVHVRGPLAGLGLSLRHVVAEE